MASEYTPFCPRYCHRSVLGIRSANKYYIQACVLGKEGDAPVVRLIAIGDCWLMLLRSG